MHDTHLYPWVSECILLSAKHFMTSMETEHFTIECDGSYSAFFVILFFVLFFLRIPKFFLKKNIKNIFIYFGCSGS